MRSRRARRARRRSAEWEFSAGHPPGGSTLTVPRGSYGVHRVHHEQEPRGDNIGGRPNVVAELTARLRTLHEDNLRQQAIGEIWAMRNDLRSWIATSMSGTFVDDALPTLLMGGASRGKLVVVLSDDSVGAGTFTEVELAYLATQRLGRLATAQPDGTLQNSPVGFDVNTAMGTIDIYGFRLATSRKYRNVVDNGRAAFVVDDIASVEPWRVRFLEIRGVAEATEIDGRPVIRLHPQRVISFGLDQDVDAHELTVHSRRIP